MTVLSLPVVVFPMLGSLCHSASHDSYPPVVTGLGEGDRQKILIHQIFNRSVKVWSRYEGLSSIPPFPLAVLTRVFPGIKFYLPKFRGKDREILSVTGYSGQGDAIFFERCFC